MMILDDVKAGYMVPIHYGTLQFLTVQTRPSAVMRRIMSENEEYLRKVKMLGIGEQFVFDEVIFRK
jgi:hypothetical protein